MRKRGGVGARFCFGGWLTLMWLTLLWLTTAFAPVSAQERVVESAVRSDRAAPNEPRPDRSQASPRERVSSDELERSENRQSAERQRKEEKPEERQPKESPSEKEKPRNEPTDEQQPVRTRPLIQRGGSLISQTLPPPPPEPPARPVSAATTSPATAQHSGNSPYEPDELLLTTLDMDEARAVARQLSAYSLRIKSRERLSGLGLVMTRFRLPPGVDPAQLLVALQRDHPDLNLDTNQRYRLMNGRRSYARTLIRWPARATPGCQVQGRIGMIDTAVNASHPALKGQALQVRTFTRGTPADDGHGTAVAALFIGNGTGDIQGLLPEVELMAAAVFRQRDEQVETTTDSLLQALDWLSTEQVRAINVSLGGEQNAVLELALQQVLSQGIAVLAAAGNEGADSPPVYPAAQDGVLAITAVDAAEQLYRHANRGGYIDYAAPGVDVWSATGEDGGRYHSGTSFAVPFATAAWLLADAAGENLVGWVNDLGPVGRDAQFGRGLLQVGTSCRVAP